MEEVRTGVGSRDPNQAAVADAADTRSGVVAGGQTSRSLARDVRFIFSTVPSVTSTDKSVCATRILPYWTNAGRGASGVAQTLLSVLRKDAAAYVRNPVRCAH